MLRGATGILKRILPDPDPQMKDIRIGDAGGQGVTRGTGMAGQDRAPISAERTASLDRARAEQIPAHSSQQTRYGNQAVMADRRQGIEGGIAFSGGKRGHRL